MQRETHPICYFDGTQKSRFERLVLEKKFQKTVKNQNLEFSEPITFCFFKKKLRRSLVCNGVFHNPFFELNPKSQK